MLIDDVALRLLGVVVLSKRIFGSYLELQVFKHVFCYVN